MTQRILLADDSVTIRRVVELTFSDEDFAIDAVGDGEQALERARAARPDIIISDVAMPGLDGYELCRRVKADPGLQAVPFLFLKGTFESFDEEKANSCGADGFIVKPFESQEMIARVKEMIAQAAPAPAREAAPPIRPPAMPWESAAPAASPWPTLAAAPPAAPAVPTAAAAPFPPATMMHRPPPPPFPEPTAAPQRPAPPPPPPAVNRPGDDFGFDFGEVFGERFSAPTAPLVQQPSAPPPEPAAETEEDLWSEVNLRGQAGDPLEGNSSTGFGGWPSAGVRDLEEAEEIADETMLDEISGIASSPPPPAVGAIAARPEPRYESPFAAESSRAIPPAQAPQHTVDPAVVERLVAERVESVVRQVLEPIVSDLARTMIETVAWEVIPDLAEAMIRAEIERISRSTRTG
jgi:CheY-like chemotaxis protein